MSGVLEVVRIVRPECPGGFCEINKTDLKESDVLFDEKRQKRKQRERLREVDLQTRDNYGSSI